MTPTWLFILYYAYGIPVVILYIAVIYTLFKHKAKFPSVFYRLVAIFGIQEVLGYFLTQYVERLPTCQFVYSTIFYQLQEPSKVQVIIFFTYFYTHFQGVMAGTILAFNRMSSILFPLQHDLMWKKYFYMVMIVYYISPFSCYWHLLFNKAVLVCDMNVGMERRCYFTYDHSRTFGLSTGTNMKISFFSLSLLSCVFNVTTMVMLMARRKSLKIRRAWGQEINFFVTSFILFLIHLGYGIIQITVPTYYDSLTMAAKTTFIFGFLIPLLYDIVLIGTVLSLLIGSMRLREEVVKMFFFSLRVIEKRSRSVYTFVSF